MRSEDSDGRLSLPLCADVRAEHISMRPYVSPRRISPGHVFIQMPNVLGEDPSTEERSSHWHDVIVPLLIVRIG